MSTKVYTGFRFVACEMRDIVMAMDELDRCCFESYIQQPAERAHHCSIAFCEQKACDENEPCRKVFETSWATMAARLT